MPLACFLVIQSAAAQLPTATIFGTVKDATGGMVPGTTITATNMETGRSRSGVTAEDGSYKFSALPVGTYEVRAERPGFEAAVQKDLKLNVGQDAVINLSLQVGAVEQTVAVTAEAPMIETTTATVSGLVGQNEVRDLPLNARNLVELATLFPGITFARQAASNGPSGFATKLAIVGTRFESNLFQLDGQDINDSTGGAGGAAGILMGVETIREFNVITNGYSAEYGKHSGGVFNAVSKSGTNSLHGSLFEFFRNEKLDARNFFDSQIPPYKRNQFGFSVGGPIVKDRTFFFGSYEGLRERLGLTNIYTVPDAGARQGVLPNPTTGVVQTIPVAPGVQPYLNSYPLPNGRNFGNGTGEFAGAQSFPTNENYFTLRADQTLSAKDSLFARYTFDDANRATAQSFNSNNLASTRTQYAAVGETHLFSPQVVNMLLLGFNRSVIGQIPVTVPGFTFPSTTFTTFTEPIGVITTTGLSAWGGNIIIPINGWLNQFQVKDDVFYTRGAHSFKFGFNAERLQFKNVGYNYAAGSWTFNSLSAFLTGTVTQVNFLAPSSDPAVYSRQTLYGAYAQDDIRLSPRFMLNLGLRYEPVTQDTILHGRTSNLHNYLTPGQTPQDLVVGNPPFLNPSLRNIAPRVGFAWNPTGSGKTSIRGGAGVFFDQIFSGSFAAAAFETAAPFYGTINLFAANNPVFPTAFYALSGSAQPLTLQVDGLQYKPVQPTVYKYSLNVQREIAPNTSAEVGFSATRGVHLIRPIYANMPVAQQVAGRIFIPSTAPFVHPLLGRTRERQSDVTSSYYGMQMQVSHRSSHGLMVRGAYTYSKVVDDGSNWSGALDWGGTQLSRYLTIKDKGLAAFDIRHALSVSFTYDLPGSNLKGTAGKIAGGWQTNGILTVQSGTPFNITSGALPSWMTGGFVADYPDLVAGAHVQYNTRNPNRYFTASAFTLPSPGIVGNLARDFGIGPGIAALNLVLAKQTRLSERINLQFRAELFNLFNRANFNSPASGAVYNAVTRAASPAIGRITNTGTTSRQLQLGLKVEF